MGLILFILICYGLTNAITKESVFSWLRNIINKWFPKSILNKIIVCPTCCSFYVGIIISFLLPTLIPLHIIYCGLISSASISILQKIEYKF